MDQTMIRVVAAVMAVVFGLLLFLRRRKGKTE
jgi:hypothetical protein